MQVAICGLGRMGAGMARRAARGGHDVVVWNRTETVANEIAGEAENEGRVTVYEVRGGFADVTPEGLTILAEHAAEAA